MNFCLTPQRSQLTHIRTQSESAAPNEPRIPAAEGKLFIKETAYGRARPSVPAEILSSARPQEAIPTRKPRRRTALRDSEQFLPAAYEAYEQLIRLPWSPEPQPTPVFLHSNLSSSLKRADLYVLALITKHTVACQMFDP